MAQRDDSTILVHNVVAGDADGLHRVIARFTPLLMAAARHRVRRHLRDVYTAELLMQDVWRMAVPGLGSLRARAGGAAFVVLRYLCGLLVDRYGTLLQRLANAKPLDPVAAEPLPAETAQALEQAMHGAATAAVREYLDRLDEHDREVIVLRAIEQASDEEAAAATGLRVQQVAEAHGRVLPELQRQLPDSVFVELVDDA